MRIAALSDIGLVRTRNEDAFWYDKDRAILILADGLGGHKAGEIAATLAVQIVAERLSHALDQNATDQDLIDAMQEAFGDASEQVFRRGKSSEKLTGMACSLIAAIMQQDFCYLAHAGDSRAYLYFEDNLSQMTVDDTPVAALIKRGYLLPEKASSHQMKNVLVKSVGSKRNLDANITKFPVKTGERLLLCSDGLWGSLEHRVISDVLKEETDPGQVCIRLVDLARNSGGKDNITVIVADIEGQQDSVGIITIPMPKITD